MADEIEILRKKSIEQLEKEYDAKAQSTVIGLDFLRREIEWRHQSAQQNRLEDATIRMKNLTEQMFKMTWAVIILTVINIIVAIIPIVQK